MRFLLFLLSVTLAHAASITGKVVGVTDGDTLTLLVEADGKRDSVRVRMWGIDAPETKQAFGTRAKEELSKRVFGKTVVVEVKDKDRYGRTVGLVSVGDLPVNFAMIAAGYAWWYQQFAPDSLAYQKAQADAKAAKRGLWSEPNPVPPWEFRRTESAAKAKKD